MSVSVGKRRRDERSPEPQGSAKKLSNVQAGLRESIKKTIGLIERSTKILILVGAGISTSAGIPGMLNPRS